MSVISPGTFVTALRDHGVHVVEHQVGGVRWDQHTSAGGWDPRGVMHHHTAGSSRLLRDRATQTAMRRILWSGRPGLPGPLSHLGLAWQPWAGRAVAHCTGWGNCNHAGSGDRRVLDQVIADQYDGSLLGTREDADGNVAFYGLEYMHPGDSTPWPDELLELGVRCGAAICQAHGWTAASNIEHFEWASRRKVDRSAARVGGHNIRAEVARLIGGDDMALSDADIDKIADRTAAKILDDRMPALVDRVRRALDGELGDESGRGEFSDRVAAKVAARVPGGDPVAIAAAIVDELAGRLRP